jgi:hypothetical protein
MLDDLARRIDDMSKITLSTGVLSGHFYPDGTSLAEVTVTQEFGDPSKHIPARPFMRPALTDNKAAMASEALKQLNDGKEAADVATFLGSYLVGAMRKKIRDLHAPVLRPLTIKKRLERGNTSIKPLINSGYMQASLQYRVDHD